MSKWFTTNQKYAWIPALSFGEDIFQILPSSRKLWGFKVTRPILPKSPLPADVRYYPKGKLFFKRPLSLPYMSKSFTSNQKWTWIPALSFGQMIFQIHPLGRKLWGFKVTRPTLPKSPLLHKGCIMHDEKTIVQTAANVCNYVHHGSALCTCMHLCGRSEGRNTYKHFSGLKLSLTYLILILAYSKLNFLKSKLHLA